MRRRNVPEPLPGELARPRLVALLGQRFTHAVTIVTAGAGFGKSTSLAQAVRHNEASPVGLDVWISCRPGDEDAEQLSARILEALGADLRTDGDPVGAIERAIIEHSPIDVCLVLDDVHLLVEGSSGAGLLDELVRRLPATGHLLLAARVAPSVPVARHRAAGAVLEVGEAELAFDEPEVAALARAAGRPSTSVSDLAGWPALVRLGLIAPPGADRAFLVEEVVAGLADTVRQVLFGLTLLGPADDVTVGTVLGESVDLDAALRGVPLVSQVGKDQFVAHQLWHEPLRAALPDEVVGRICERATDVLLEHGQHARAAAAAISIGSVERLSRIATAVLARHLNHIPVDTVRPWLRHVSGAPLPASLRLLDAMVRYTDDVRDPSITTLIDAALAESEASDDLGLEIAAIGAAAIVAHARNDLGRLVHLAQRATELPGSDDPVITLLRSAVPAITADLEGDPEGVLAALAAVPWSRLPLGAAQLIGRLYLQALWMTGRAEESIGFTDTWFGGSESFLGGLPALARWFAGHPGVVWRDGIGVDPAETNDRDLFVGTCFMTVIGAGCGARADIERLWADGRIESLAFDNARDSAHLTYAGAVRAVMRCDEAAAAERYRRHLQRHPVTDRLGERHLRRFPALGYVLNEELRAHWDSVELGPAQIAARRSARALLAARRGERPSELAAVGTMVTHLPLPWMLELVGRLAATEDERTGPLAADLLAQVGPGAVDTFADSPEPMVRFGVATVRSLAPRAGARVSVRVLGPLGVDRDGEPLDVPELRRGRVRQLLSLLVVERTVSRDRAVEVLWPDLTPAAAAGNLRVTLTHLRRVLDGDTVDGRSAHRVRADNRSITLHPSDHLWVDLWHLDTLLSTSEGAPFDIHRGIDGLRRVAACFRGDPLPDLADLPACAPVVESYRMVQLDTLLRLGEMSISAGSAAEAWACGEQAIGIDPYREQAHRLLLAAALRLDDVARLRNARSRLQEMLDELGVTMDPSTAVLARRAERRLAD